MNSLNKTYTKPNTNTDFHVIYETTNYQLSRSGSVDYFPSVGGHLHDSHEIYFFLEGDVTYFVDGSYYSLKPYDMLLINNREIHNPIFNSDAYYDRIILNVEDDISSIFNVDQYDLCYCFRHHNPGQNNLIPAEIVKERNLFQYYEQIFKLSQLETTDETHLLMNTYLIQLLAHINNAYKGLTKRDEYELPSNYSKVQLIVNHINKNLFKHIRLDDLASEFYISKYHLCHIFKESTGFTIQEYIIHKKIILAKEMLVNGHNASEIALSLGFKDYSGFYRTFKKHVGLSPSDFNKM